MSYELRRVTSAEDRVAMHAIRRATLFAPDRPGGLVVYDENRPHDLNPANQCFLLVLDERRIGVARLDPRGEREGVVRLVAIVPALQRQGHGRVLGELIETEARRHGMVKLALNARERMRSASTSGWVGRLKSGTGRSSRLLLLIARR